jgi:hypothetical protein
MYRKIWKDCHQSICCINFIGSSNAIQYTLSGFKSGNFIITDGYVYKIMAAKEVEIKFVAEDGFTPDRKITLPFWEFQDKVIDYTTTESKDFALIRMDGLDFEDIPSLKLCQKINYEIGQPLAVLGFELEKDSLSIKAGMVSSYYHDKTSNSDYIQFESTIKNGNSGSPLINIENEEVIGIVGHRLSTLTQAYDEMIKVINNNVKVLKKVEKTFSLSDVDPIQVMIASQNQIKFLARELYKSANMRYGYATNISEVTDCLKRTSLDTTFSQLVYKEK